MRKICDKNILKEKYEKSRNYLFNMKEMNKSVLGKGLMASIKWKLCLTKGQLCNQEGQVEFKYPLIGSCF